MDALIAALIHEASSAVVEGETGCIVGHAVPDPDCISEGRRFSNRGVNQYSRPFVENTMDAVGRCSGGKMKQRTGLLRTDLKHGGTRDQSQGWKSFRRGNSRETWVAEVVQNALHSRFVSVQENIKKSWC